MAVELSATVTVTVTVMAATIIARPARALFGDGLRRSTNIGGVYVCGRRWWRRG
jgi:hypothetical protein